VEVAAVTCPALTGLIPMVFAWGGDAPSSVTLRPAEPPAVAEVVFVNTLTFGSPGRPFHLTLGPMVVEIFVEFGPGRIPETLVVDPPEGFVAAPRVSVVDDGTTAVVPIFCSETMGMG
jgi:hypothetical protein